MKEITTYRERTKRNEARKVRIVPALNKVIKFTYKKKELTGKVVLVTKRTDCFEVEANGSRFLVSEFAGAYSADVLLRARKYQS